MADVDAIYHWTDGDTITAARLNTVEGIVTRVNADFFQKNKSSQTISVAFTVSAAVTISAGGLAVTGGLTVATVGITVSAGGITVTGNSTITGTLGGLTGLTVASGGVTVTAGNVVITAGNLTLTAGHFVMVAGQASMVRYNAGDSGTSLTINWNNGNIQRTRLTGNCTFTFSNPVVGASYMLEVLQDGTGSRTVTWPSTVKWDGNVAPTITATANRKDVVAFVWNGTNYMAAVYGQNFNETT